MDYARSVYIPLINIKHKSSQKMYTNNYNKVSHTRGTQMAQKVSTYIILYGCFQSIRPSNVYGVT